MTAAPPPAVAPPPSSPSLAALKWKRRVVVVFAPAADDQGLAIQRKALGELTRAADDRDLVVVEVVGGSVSGTAESAAALRRRFHATGGFHAVLIGKDGGVKLSESRPIPAERLTSTIDAMPMRRDEMKR